MAYLDDPDGSLLIVNPVDRSIVPGSEASVALVRSVQGLGPRRPWIIREPINAIPEVRAFGFRQRPQRAQGVAQNENGVGRARSGVVEIGAH